MNSINRHLKIFISSTFQDMQNERESLLKDIFVEFKKEARQRDVEITEIDLRWGISEDKANSGKTVKICLDEIERCKDSPIFFIGILGNIYGWSDWYDSVDKSILDDKRYSWIKEHTDKSITELEIISALENNTQNNKAFIYLKDKTDDEDIKLVDLKNRLENFSNNSNNLHLDNYQDDKDFTTKVKKSLKNTLDELFPENEKLNEVEKLRQSHQVFAKSRQKIYIEHKDNEDILSKFIDSDKDRLLLYGDSGLGKSALISNYFDKFKKRDSDYFVIEHYIGGAGELSNDLYHILNRVMLEIKDRFDIDAEIPTEPQKIIDEFAIWLNKISTPTIIIFDGYNQIEDEMKEKLFYYLPDELSNVKLIITSTKDNYPIKNKNKVEYLGTNEKKELIVNYLNIYGKSIESNVIEKIVSHKETNNTLFLKTILDEIRLIGSNDYLYSHIDKYLASKDIVELFDKMFERFENDYEEKYPNLTQQILSLLYVSRDGLSETNLMEILKIKRLYFSSLFLALEEHLVNKNGLYGFFHDYIRKAVNERYLNDKKKIKKYRKKLANYFEKKSIDNQKIRELPFQLYELKYRKRLYKNLIKIAFFTAIYESAEYELLKYVEYIDEKYRIAHEFLQKNMNIYQLNQVAYFFHLIYIDYKTALVLFRKAFMYKEQSKNDRITHYINLGGIYISIGENKKSLPLFQKALKLSLNTNEKDNLESAFCYHNLGYLYESAEDNNTAEFYYKKSLSIREQILGINHPDTAVSYNNLAGIHVSKSNYKDALSLYKKALSISKKTLGSMHPEVATTYNNLGYTYKEKGNYKKALFFYEKSLNICLIKLGKNHPDTIISYDNLASYYYSIEKYKKAFFLQKKVLQLSESILGKNHPDIQIFINNLAVSYVNKKKYTKAKKLFRKLLSIAKTNYGTSHNDILAAYNNLAFIHNRQEKNTKALQIYKRILKIRKKKNKYHPDTAMSYNNVASVYSTLNKYSISLVFYKKALKIWENKFGKKHLDTVTAYNNLANTYESMKLFEEALSYYKKAYKYSKKILGKKHLNVKNCKINIIIIRKKIKYKLKG